ncbi:MAG: phytanoyl-CoA dioxygenase [Ponticaulis sp.]|nr:phytanoyl-CoA dioxygenase [Ponticaulis sp.]|tara:strand:+ start:73899 stop:74741 length:843 start_codon:yes stop_codon:yes gene_type:complete
MTGAVPYYMSEDARTDQDPDIAFYRDHGYLIKDFGFDPSVIDEAAKASAEIGDAGFVRAQDLWRRNQSVKSIACHNALMDLLDRLYGRKSFPFQTLNFARGSEQKPHSDTYHFSSDPEHFMCGVWVALEDVSALSGPLEFYPGSHSLSILAKADLPGPSYAEHYEPLVAQRISEHGFRRQTALLKKGQALIWAANLVHGGSPIEAATSSRLSQVTHFYFRDCVYTTPMRIKNGVRHIRSIYSIADGDYVPQKQDGKTRRPGALVAINNRLSNIIRRTRYS